MDARITSVEERTIGSALVSDTSIGAGTITVSDGTDFDLQGELQLGSEIMTYSDVNEDTGVITLVGTLASTHTADDPVYVYPQSQERIAYLVAGDNPQDEEGMAARIPHALWDKIPVGIRSWADGEGESVQADFISDELVIQELTGQDPVIDGTFVNLTGVTVPITDGLPPTSSPAIDTALGTLRYVFLKWTAITNHDQVTYEVHIGTTPGFTAGPTTKVQEISGTFAAVNTLVGGTALSYNTNYYFKLIAKDVDGAAAAGAESGPIQLNPAAPDDLAVGSVTAAKLEAFLVIANTFATAASGARIEFDSTGITLYDSLETISMRLDAQTGSIFIRGEFDFGIDATNPSRLSDDLIDLVNQPSTFQTGQYVISSKRDYSNNAGPFNATLARTSEAGNLLLLDVVIYKATGTPQTISSPPAGWTQVATATQGKLRVYTYKYELAPSKTTTGSFSLSASLGVNDTMRVSVTEVSGVQVADVSSSSNGNGTSATSGVTGTSTQAQGRHWVTFAWDDALTPTFGPVHEKVDGVDPGSTDLAFSYNYGTLPTKFGTFESQGNRTSGLHTYEFTSALSSAADWIATTVFFKAKVATGTPEAPDTGRARIYANSDTRGDTQIFAINSKGQVTQLSGIKYGQSFDWYTDFIGSAVPAEVLTYANNGGTSGLTTGLGPHPGIVRLTTGTTVNSTGNAGIRFGEAATPPIVLGSGSVRYGVLFNAPSTGTPFVNIRAGFSDQVPQNNPTAGYSFRWNGNVNTNKIQIGKSGTFSDSGVTVTGGNWYLLEIVVSADATSAEFFINGASVGTLSGAAETTPVLAGFGVDKSTSSGTSRTVDVDMLYLTGQTTVPRY